ncbi:hypothetical protein ED733_002044 [Metarhizium rileyi]|uniref:Uncharacterized protein n=1 Tax=Metarhizium rileyi (strain RCEF 4871) TaxID=1649241 RepID=A0A5C6G0E0_METRR|nr:hypothetical protein ED733_002044 [Metarhizium rileyi]
MPLLSLWLLRQSRKSEAADRPSRRQRRALLKAVFWATAVTHVGAFLVALTATILGRRDGPLHVMNSLLGVPDCSRLPCAEEAQRQARLRQINEMTGTSSGFFLTMGLYCQTPEARRIRMSWQLLVRMFLVSLILGPAAGGADVLLLRGLHRGGFDNDARKQEETKTD